MSRLVDEHGVDRGEIVETTWRDTDDPDLKCYEVFVREVAKSTECTRCGVEKAEHARSDHTFKNLDCELEYEVIGHPFVPDDNGEICARDTYGRNDHGPGPYSDPICGYRVWPYGEHNMCMLAPHQTGRHRDAEGRKFDHSGYPPKPLNKPHCRNHLEFRSDCERCIAENP